MNNLLLEHARMMATLIINRLQGRVRRVAIAGSVRRERETVNNIDLVLIPKADPQREGHTIPFMGRGKMVRLVDGQGSPEMIIQFAGFIFRPVPIGTTPTLFLLETVLNKEDMTPEGIRVSISIASEATWGHALMFRTGSQAFNEYIQNRALSRGLIWSPFSNDAGAPDGLFDPTTKAAIPAETEEDIFKALKLKFVEPVERERA